MTAIRGIENGANNPSIRNQYGYTGLYQVGGPACVDAGWCRRGATNSFQTGFTSKAAAHGVRNLSDFRQSRSAQEAMMRDLVPVQWRYVQNAGFDRHIGKTINGVYITRERLIAAVHHQGIGGLRKFLNGQNPTDGNGFDLKQYMLRVPLTADASDIIGDKGKLTPEQLAKAKDDPNATQGTATAASGGAKACAEDIKSSLDARAQIGANKESERARKAHEKPDSVLKYSCFDQAANTIAQRAGSIFTGSLVSPFRNVLGQTIGGMLENFIGGNIQSLLGDTLGSFVSSVIPFAQSEFNCKIMQAVWDIIECQGFDFEFPSLGEIAGLGRLNLGCEGQVLYGLAADQASSAIAAEIGPNRLGIDQNFIRSVMYDFTGN